MVCLMRTLLLDRTARRVCVEKPPARRGVDDPEDRHPVTDQCDVHGEIAPLLDKLLRSIQRIDDEEFGGPRRVRPGLFFGDHRNVGEGFGKAGPDHRVGGMVRLGHGA